MGTFDYGALAISFWGDGSQVIDFTSVDSTALMLAHAALGLDAACGRGLAGVFATGRRASRK